MNIIHENDDYIVINKAATESTVPDKTGDVSIQEQLESKLGTPVHPITRIDKVVSGLCLYGKHKSAADKLSEQIRIRRVKKTYLAIVEGIVEKDQERLEHLVDKKGNKAHITETGKRAVLIYNVLARLDNYTVLEVQLITGRFHQIRVQLSTIGHVIKGDVKYGARRKNKDRSIHLHSWKLKFYDQEYIADVPADALWQVAAAAL